MNCNRFLKKCFSSHNGLETHRLIYEKSNLLVYIFFFNCCFFPNNSIMVCPKKLKIDILYLMDNRKTVFQISVDVPLKAGFITILTGFNRTQELGFNRFNHIQHLHTSIFTLIEFNSFKISFSIKTRTVMDVTVKIILLTLILRKDAKKRKHVQNIDFGYEIFLPEENRMVNFTGQCKS